MGSNECNVPTPINKGHAGKELTCIDFEKDGRDDDVAG